MKALALVVLLVGCSGQVVPETQALPPECSPPAFAPSDCVDGMSGWRSCGAPDGSKWVYFPADYLEGGYEHLGADGKRICRVWNNGAYALAAE